MNLSCIMIKSEICDFMQLVCISIKTSFSLRGNINEVFILVDLGGAVRFFVFVSYLRLPDAGRIPAAQV